MPTKLYRVNLTQEEREHLLGITRRGKSSGRKVKRSLILCKADEGLTDQQVAEALMVGPATVGRVRQRFVEGGLKRALDDLPRPGQRRTLWALKAGSCMWWPWLPSCHRNLTPGLLRQLVAALAPWSGADRLVELGLRDRLRSP